MDLFEKGSLRRSFFNSFAAREKQGNAFTTGNRKGQNPIRTLTLLCNVNT